MLNKLYKNQIFFAFMGVILVTLEIDTSTAHLTIMEHVIWIITLIFKRLVSQHNITNGISVGTACINDSFIYSLHDSTLSLIHI